MKLPSQDSNYWLVGMTSLILVGGLVVYVATSRGLTLYLGGLAIIVGILWAGARPERWVYLVIFLIPLTPEIPLYLAGYGPGRGFWKVTAKPSDFIVPLAIGLFLVKRITHRGQSFISDYYLGIPLALYLFFAFTSLLFRYIDIYSTSIIWNGLGHLLKWAGYFLLYFIIISEFRDPEKIYGPLRLIIFAFAMGTVFTITQYFRAVAENPIYERISPLRSSGMMSGVNGYAVTLAFLIIIIFSIILRGEKQKIFPKLFLNICLGLYGAALLFTFSRAGWLTAFLGLGLVSLRGKRSFLAVPLLIGAVATMWFASQPVQMRVDETLNPTRPEEEEIPINLGGRTAIWEHSIRQIDLKNFFVGCGYFCFPFIYKYTTPHNQYLSLILEVGIFGLAAFLWILYRMLKYLLFIYRYSNNPFLRELAFSSMIGLTMILLACLSGEFFYGGNFTFIILAVIATVQVLYRQEYLERLADVNSASVQNLQYTAKEYSI